MLIFFGTRKVRIRTFNDESAPCALCGEYRKQYRIYQPCFHIFWIPVIPIGRKYIVTNCTKCNAQYEVAQHPELSATRTPLYMFSIPLIFAAIFVFAMINAQQSSKRTEEYVQNPAAGDVYLIRDTIDGDRYYYFTKILHVEPDSVFIQMGAYSYKSYTSRMDNEDYYVTDYLYAVHKDELKEWHRDKMIRKIERTEEP